MVSCACLKICGDFQLPLTVGFQPFFKLQNSFFKRSLKYRIWMGETGHNNIAGVESPYKYVPLPVPERTLQHMVIYKSFSFKD